MRLSCVSGFFRWDWNSCREQIMNNRQKKMGYNAAQELMHNLGMPAEETTNIKNWDLY